MVTTDDDQAAAEVRLRRSHGMTASTLDRHQGRASAYDVVTEGYNYRLDEIRAALALAQLGRLAGFLDERKRVYQEYLRALSDVPEVAVPFQGRSDEEVGYHIFPVLLRRGVNRAAVIAAMKERGIQVSVHYRPSTGSAPSRVRRSACRGPRTSRRGN